MRKWVVLLAWPDRKVDIFLWANTQDRDDERLVRIHGIPLTQEDEEKVAVLAMLGRNEQVRGLGARSGMYDAIYLDMEE